MRFNRQRGNATVNAALWSVSPGFESNDLGFQNGGDAGGMHAVVLWRKPNPDKWMRSRYAWAGKWWTWDFGKRITGNGVQGEAGLTTMSYWGFWVNAGKFWRVLDNRLTRGGRAATGNGGGYITRSR